MTHDPSAVADQIHVEQLEVFARVGVTENERAAPQRLTFSVTVWPTTSFEKSADDIARTVNYSAIAVAVRDFARERSCKLIETLAAKLAAHLLEAFPISKVQIELRKFVLPEARHVSVRLVRNSAGNS
jgi:dihydroneopterin aldolase